MTSLPDCCSEKSDCEIETFRWCEISVVTSLDGLLIQTSLSGVYRGKEPKSGWEFRLGERGKISWKYVQVWLGLICCVFFFLLLTTNNILNYFSLAADFVRFFVHFGPVRPESTWPSLSKRQNCQVGSFCDICELWRFCLHFLKAGKFASWYARFVWNIY